MDVVKVINGEHIFLSYLITFLFGLFGSIKISMNFVKSVSTNVIKRKYTLKGISFLSIVCSLNKKNWIKENIYLSKIEILINKLN